ncbi:MAG: prepilin-type N-terminal cleavage/methylation domain-containing protein [Hylemonella sp.]|nr:prepilin-type N-terminal cleavage/methylation domain-containing protein [Hylemonella sp.]
MKAATQRGFTLIELMVVVTIIAIISAIAYPSYNKYLVRSKRSAAQSFMFSVANKQEQYLLDRRTYADSLVALNIPAPADVAQNYTITTTPDMTATPPSYEVKAVPLGAQAGDSLCATLTLHSVTGKGITGTGTIAACW